MESPPLFQDRAEAGRMLAERLSDYGRDPLVIGIPRGGVVVAAELARALEAELDVIVARKVGAPGYAELAIGAVTADGGCYLNRDSIAALGVTSSYLQAAIEAQITVARAREERLRRVRPRAQIHGRVVILVDDGLATGATMRAAVRSIRNAGPARLIVAVPVGAPDTCMVIAREVDALLCPHQPDAFGAVGRYYRHFEPVDDLQVERLLQAARQAPDLVGTRQL